MPKPKAKPDPREKYYKMSPEELKKAYAELAAQMPSEDPHVVKAFCYVQSVL
jgi:hypothetical protein